MYMLLAIYHQLLTCPLHEGILLNDRNRVGDLTANKTKIW